VELVESHVTSSSVEHGDIVSAASPAGYPSVG
jgi:hypothetical protein